jgi:hypothetical protein
MVEVVLVKGRKRGPGGLGSGLGRHTSTSRRVPLLSAPSAMFWCVIRHRRGRFVDAILGVLVTLFLVFVFFVLFVFLPCVKIIK